MLKKAKNLTTFWNKIGIIQCQKLRVHPASGVHIYIAGCVNFGRVHPECARFLGELSLLYTRRLHGEFPGCTVLGGVHTVGAQSKI